MKQHCGVWLPDHEVHLLEQLQRGAGTYQWQKQSMCYGLLERRKSKMRTAIDVGAHVGLWSMYIARKFKWVFAFEPVGEHRACFAMNVLDKNVTLHAMALGDHTGRVGVETEVGSSGNTHIVPEGNISVVQLDSFFFEDVDFIKIDCEGYEYFVLQGGRMMIQEQKPMIIVEQKHDFASTRYGIGDRAAVKLLESWGAKLQFELSGDYCFAWEG